MTLRIVPPSFTWTPSTVKLLEEFAAQGGVVVFLGDRPTHIAAEHAPERWQKLLGNPGVHQSQAGEEALRKTLDGLLPRDVTLTAQQGTTDSVIYHHRRVNNRHLYMLVNKDREHSVAMRVSVPIRGAISNWDLTTGKVSPIPSGLDPHGTTFDAELPPAGSLAFVVEAGAAPALVTRLPKLKTIMTLSGPWAFERREPNSYPLGFCQYSMNGEEWQGPMPVWQVRNTVWKAAGLEPYKGLREWVLRERGIKIIKPLDLRIRFEFESDLDAPKVELVVEEVEKFVIDLNGERVMEAGAPPPTAWHWDKNFRVLTIGRFVRRGTNQIALHCAYDWSTPVEDIYLIGDFGTRQVTEREFTIIPEPTELQGGDWVPQGLHFHAGNLVYKKSFQLDGPLQGSRHVRLIGARGTAYAVRLNGRVAAHLGWAPLEADITHLIRDGENHLEVEVVTSLRNTFGPLHNDRYKTEDNRFGVGPRQFEGPNHWTDAFWFEPYGLEAVEILKAET